MSEQPMASGWYYSKPGVSGAEQVGPFSWEQLFAQAQTGALAPADLVWNPQLPQWTPAAQVPGLFPAGAWPGAQAAYPGAAQPVPQAQQPWTGYHQPYPGQSSGPYPTAKAGGRSWLAWVIPLAVLVLAGAGVGLYFGLRGDSGGTPVVSTGTSIVRTTTTGEVTTTESAVTTTTAAATTTTAAPITTTTTPTAPAAWTQLSPAGSLPAIRESHSMAFDPGTGAAVLFGGWNADDMFNDTWIYRPAEDRWEQQAPSGSLPARRVGAPMVSDPISGRILLFCGWSQDVQFNDIWAYDPNTGTWTELKPGGALPKARGWCSVAYDSASDKLIMFGGWDEAGASELGDTWAYDAAANVWTELKPSGSAPSPREGHKMAYDPVGNRTYLYGGFNGDDERFDDLWAYDWTSNTWTQLNPAGDRPSRRAAHALVYDSAKARLVLFGGYDGANDLNDLWAYDPAAGNWSDITPKGTLPAARDNHTVIYDSIGDQLIVFGGWDGEKNFNDIWAFGS